MYKYYCKAFDKWCDLEFETKADAEFSIKCDVMLFNEWQTKKPNGSRRWSKRDFEIVLVK